MSTTHEVETAVLPDPPTRRARRRPPTEHFRGVDGARGIAIVSVLLYHSGWSERGLFGVDVFFVISGFLITFLLIREVEATGRIRFGRFYARRAKRLLPGLAVTLLTVLVVLWWAGSLREIRDAGATAIASVLQLANWQQLGADIAYQQDSGALVPLGQMWSLSATEQFYIVWPLLLAGLWPACRRHPGRLAIALFSLVVVAGAVAPLLFDGSNVDRLYLGTDARAVAFVAGAAFAGAVVWVRQRAPVWAGAESSRYARVAITAASVLSLVAVLAASVLTETYRDPWLYRGGFAAVAVAAGLFVATLCLPANPLGRIFAWRPFVAIGVVSYSMFLLHLPVFWMLQQQAKGTMAPLALFAVGGVATWLASVVLHHLITEPLRTKKWRPLAATLTIVIAFGAVLAAAWLLPAERAGHPKSHLLALEQSRPKSGFAGNPTPTSSTGGPLAVSKPTALPKGHGGGPLRVAIVGDSVAGNMFEALTSYGSGGVSAVDLSFGGCGILETENARNSQGAIARGEFCPHWQSELRAESEANPPDVYLIHNLWDANDQLIGGEWVGPCSPAWQERYAAQLDAIAAIGDSARQPPVILVSTDRVRDGDEMITRERLDCKNRAATDAAARHGNIGLLDLEKGLCPAGKCAVDTGEGQALYRDGIHFSVAGLTLLGPWLENELGRAVTKHTAR